MNNYIAYKLYSIGNHYSQYELTKDNCEKIAHKYLKYVKKINLEKVEILDLLNIGYEICDYSSRIKDKIKINYAKQYLKKIKNLDESKLNENLITKISTNFISKINNNINKTIKLSNVIIIIK